MDNKATETELTALHGVVAQVLKEQLTERVEMTDPETGEQKEVAMATPAMIAQAIKFLKDNNITVSVEEDDNLNELDDLLRKKREKRALRPTLASVQ